jgi:hypothetical protein
MTACATAEVPAGTNVTPGIGEGRGKAVGAGAVQALASNSSAKVALADLIDMEKDGCDFIQVDLRGLVPE